MDGDGLWEEAPNLLTISGCPSEVSVVFLSNYPELISR